MYKKLIASVAAIAIAFGTVGVPAVESGISVGSAISASAATLTYGDYEYEVLDDGTVEITKYTGNDTEVEIPSEIDGKAVTVIGDYAFWDNRNITSVVIPNGVTSIGESAFWTCKSLADITIPDSVTSISESAFAWCEKLYDIAIPSNVTSIGRHAFEDTPWLKNKSKENPLVVVNGILIDASGCSGDVVIPDDVTCIVAEAFLDCESLTSVTIPQSVTSIDFYAVGYFYDYSEISNCYDYIKRSDFKITCYSGTEGETYAKENGLDYEAIYDQMTHPHNFVLVSESATTCTSVGKRTYECECGVISTTSYIKGHTKVTDKAVASTCTADGKTEGSHCSVCGEVITAQTTVKATGHKYTVTKTVKPTTTAQGYTLKKCSVCGNTTKTNYTAKLIAMSKTKATIAKSTYAYTGKSLTPTVTVKYGKTTLKKGTDYTVSYKNNKATGKATITVKGKGKYSGTVTKTFIIVPKKATVTSAKSAKTKTVTVTWKKDTQASGYQLVYSTNSKFKSSKSVNIAKNSTVKKTLTKLTKGKTYYVKVRSYKTIGGKKYYGAYSAVKKVKCK